ncbi:hypothetical protein HRbin11_02076 [bacterium HR11]|nr:hypothetical protein HRbin11_02076 [bacterium HR11]
MAYEATLLDVARLRMPVERDRLLLLFVAVNLLFLTVDVAIAHSVNGFVPRYELAPLLIPPWGIVTSLALAFRRTERPWLYAVHSLLMALSVVTGVLGFAFHLYAVMGPARRLAWWWLAFGAPVLAPLSYAGVGLVGWVAVMSETPDGRLRLGPWLQLNLRWSKTQVLMALVALGFLGATLTSYFDHAQYGYTAPEWIPVFAGLFAFLYTSAAALRPDLDRADARGLLVTLLGMVAVGLLGFAFHLSRDLADTGQLTLERMRSWAPILAPLLFSDLGLLGLVSALQAVREEATA